MPSNLITQLNPSQLFTQRYLAYASCHLEVKITIYYKERQIDSKDRNNLPPKYADSFIRLEDIAFFGK